MAEVKPEETKPEPQKEEAVEAPVEGKKVPTKGLEEDFQPIKMNNSVPHRYPMNEPVVIQPPAPADFETKKEGEVKLFCREKLCPNYDFWIKIKNNHFCFVDKKS